MIKKDNIRLQITVSKKQFEWLNNVCKTTGMSKTDYVRRCIDKNQDKWLKYLTEDEMKELRKIAQIKWLDDE